MIYGIQIIVKYRRMICLFQDQDSELSSEMAQYPTNWLAADQYDSTNESLVTKVEEVHQNVAPSPRQTIKRKAECNGLSTYTSEADTEDEDELHRQGISGSGVGSSGSGTRRVRARSLIDDEQLAVLKGYYAVNPRPKKEEITMIANYINFPTRVVQVKLDLFLLID
jgi:hypothetical protein